MKLENRLVPKDFTLCDIQNIQSEEWGSQIITDERATLIAGTMSKLQVPLHYEEWEFSDLDLFRIGLALVSHPTEAQEFIVSVYQLIKEE